MSKRILPFREDADTSEIPRPVHAQRGDVFVRVDVTDGTYARSGFVPGAVLIAQSGRVVKSALHYVEYDGYGFLARAHNPTRGSVRLEPLDGETRAGAYPRDNLDFIGLIIEIYPRGLSGSRWALCSVTPTDTVRPLLRAVAN